MKSEYTQKQKILAIMIEKRNEKTWFYPPDFMQSNLGELFVGYMASARLSEMANTYPIMFESRKKGKYMERRLRWEKIHDWWFIVPREFRAVFMNYSMYPDKVKQNA